MKNPNGKLHTADFTVDPGFSHVDLILSTDFTGTIQKVAFSGATDAVMSFDGAGDLLNEIKVVITTGTVRAMTT